MKQSTIALPTIVISQFFCTSLWFAGNGVMSELVQHFNLGNNALGHLTSSVQFGFIFGSLLFAILTITDRFSPSKVFLVCAILGSIFNAAIIWNENNFVSIVLFRFTTGFFLAGIYPVGMKIASDYYETGLGKSLGYLVGALVIGTAFPHLAKQITESLSWKIVIIFTSILAVLGGLLMLIFVPNRPYRKTGKQLNILACFKIFRNQQFRSASFGYFGHMWELYAFWTFVPIILNTYTSLHPDVVFNIPILTFVIIGIGSIACIFSGHIGQLLGTKRTASIALFLSCICCLISPLFFFTKSENLFICYLIFWGMNVIADSPLFSTLVAKYSSPEIRGTALTVVNCIGFSITIVSIQMLNMLQGLFSTTHIFTILSTGPILGLIALYKKVKSDSQA